MADQEYDSGVGKVLAAFFAGAAVGAGLSLLLAPKSGEEVRRAIKEMTGDSLDKLKDFTADAQDKLREVLEQGKEKLMEKKSILSSAMEAGKEAMAAADKEKGEA